MNVQSKEYQVALSYASEDRAYVEEVAAILDKYNIKYFYDQCKETELWGKDLYSHLSDVYQKQAYYSVIFISKYYASKLWTKHEYKSAQARAFTENREYILPVRFDDTELPGLLKTIMYIDLREKTPLDLAKLICEKLRNTQEIVNSNGIQLDIPETKSVQKLTPVFLHKLNQNDTNYVNAMKKLKKMLSEYITDFKFPGDLIDETAKEYAFKIIQTRAIIFGHTGAGKTTTLNRLLDKNIFLANGQLTCTKSLIAAQLKEGLIFYDSPGIGDEPKQENITRIALGVDQLEEKRVSTIQLLDMTEMHCEGPNHYTKLEYKHFADEINEERFNANINNRIVGKQFELDQYRKWQSHFPFDFAIFLMSSEKGLSYSDSKLLRDFRLAYPDIIIFKAFNIFHDRYKSNVNDLNSEIHVKLCQAQSRFKEAGFSNYENWIVIDSKNGQGMEEFVNGLVDCLPVNVLKSLTKIINQEYSSLIQKKFDQYFFDYLAHIAALIAVFPVDHSDGRKKFLKLALESLLLMAEYMSPNIKTKALNPFLKDIIKQIEIMSTKVKYEDRKMYRPGIWKIVQDLFELYHYEREKTEEYCSIGGINSIKHVLPIGFVICQLFRGNINDDWEIDILMEENKRKINIKLKKYSEQIRKITYKAGKRIDKEDKIELADKLYPHIRQILKEI